MVDQVKRAIAKTDHVILLGGGHGFLAKEAELPGKTWANLELRNVEGAYVPTIKGDMEQFREFSRIRKPGKNAVITPFSLEYTQMALSVQTIQELLQTNERWIWLCHHADSPIIEDFRDMRRFLGVINEQILPALKIDPDEWYTVAHDAQRALHEIYKIETEIVRASSQRLQELHRICLENTCCRLSLAMMLVIALRVGRNPMMENAARANIRNIAELFRKDLAIAGPLLDLDMRTPQDLAAIAGKGFRLIEGESFQEPNTPWAVLGVFERTNET